MFQYPLHLHRMLLIWLSRLSLFTKFMNSVISVVNTAANNIHKGLLSNGFMVLWSHLQAAISSNWLKLIFKFYRYDALLTWEQRKVQEKFWHIREVRDNLISEARNAYNLDPYGTIDEMVPKFRWSSSFRQYMASKPARYNKVLDSYRCSKPLLLLCYAILRWQWGQSSCLSWSHSCEKAS